MPNHFTVTIGQDPPYPCEYDVETNTLKAELPGSSPLEQSQLVTIGQDSGNMLHQQIWAHAMAYLNGGGVFDIPASPAPAGASPISDDEMASMTRDAPRSSFTDKEVLADNLALMGLKAANAEKMATPATNQHLLGRAGEEIALLQAELGILRDGPQTSPDTVIAVQRVIINQMHSLYAVAVDDNEKMLAVMQRLLEDGEMVYNDWRSEDGNP